MSNTLNTPIEALELEFPLRVVRSTALRRGSGGAGRHRGGDGVVRELEALEPMRYSLITERRRHAPPRRAAAARTARRAATCSTASELRRKATGELAPGSGCGSRPPAAAGMARLMKVRSSGSGSWGRGWPRTSPDPGFELTGWNRTSTAEELPPRTSSGVIAAYARRTPPRQRARLHDARRRDSPVEADPARRCRTARRAPAQPLRHRCSVDLLDDRTRRRRV